MKYAGFWKRFAASWVDLAVLSPLMAVMFWLSDKWRLFHLYCFLPGLFIGLWFHVYLVKKYGGTPGKLLLKIRITKLDGSAVGYREAVIRFSVELIFSTLISLAMISSTLQISNTEYFSLDFQQRNIRLAELAPFWFFPVNVLMNIWIWSEFVVMLTNKRRRSIHDYMAGTVVIRPNV